LRMVLAILLCKLLYQLERIIGKGSSLPGVLALKLCPDILLRIMLPDTIIAVTGSNGKTTTSQMLAHALEADGKKVALNSEGSNQIGGITTLLLRYAGLNGAMKCDVIVMECDERHAKSIFGIIRPSIIVITNLCRDQLTRNGHPEFVLSALQAAVREAGENVTLVLNADEPYSASLAMVIPQDQSGINHQSNNKHQSSNKLVYYGVGSNAAKQRVDSAGVYDDGAHCPLCKAPMSYDYRLVSHFGGFCCSVCGYRRVTPEIEVTAIDYSSGIVRMSVAESVVTGDRKAQETRMTQEIPELPESQDTQESQDAQEKQEAQKAQIVQKAQELQPERVTRETKKNHEKSVADEISARLIMPSLTAAYNLTAAIAGAAAAGGRIEAAAQGLDMYKPTGGRTVDFTVNGRQGTLLVSKHENSLSYNQSMAYVIGLDTDCTVVIMVDSISRKYYTSDISWLWDIDFDMLAHDAVRSIVLTGQYSNDLAARFAMTSVDMRKVVCADDYKLIRETISASTTGEIFALTCFADKAKLLKALK